MYKLWELFCWHANPFSLNAQKKVFCFSDSGQQDYNDSAHQPDYNASLNKNKKHWNHHNTGYYHQFYYNNINTHYSMDRYNLPQ